MAAGQGDGQREEQDAGAHGHGACEAARVGARRDVAVAHGGHGDDRPQLLADATETPHELRGNQWKSMEICSQNAGWLPCFAHNRLSFRSCYRP